jgi:hypothetical protein
METERLPRNAAVIACEVLQQIPETETEFKNDLLTFITGDLAYRAPELLTHPNIWRSFDKIINKHIQDTDLPWKKNCIDVYLGIPKE